MRLGRWIDDTGNCKPRTDPSSIHSTENNSRYVAHGDYIDWWKSGEVRPLCPHPPPSPCSGSRHGTWHSQKCPVIRRNFVLTDGGRWVHLNRYEERGRKPQHRPGSEPTGGAFLTRTAVTWAMTQLLPGTQTGRYYMDKSAEVPWARSL